MLTINFTGRKPSRAQIMSKVLAVINEGAKDIEVLWGENWIELVRGGYVWHGAGWIKDVSGDDLAIELNKG